jgi:hypothetical protein
MTEVDAAGSVPELLAPNPLDQHVLLYDGEELLGAKQNRILNVTVLAAAKSEARMLVSCVAKADSRPMLNGFSSRRSRASRR